MRKMMFSMLVVGLSMVAGKATAADQPGQVVPVAHLRIAAPAGGCTTCGMGAGGTTPGHHVVRIGAGCETPVGCTPLIATRTFAFGSCSQFFNAGNDCNFFKGRSGHGTTGGCGTAATPPCTYGSYMNR